MFWTKYENLCEQNSLKPRDVARELEIAPATVTKWKNGAVPNYEMLSKIANYFSVTVDYLVNEEDIDINLKEKRKSGVFKTLLAIPERWASLRRGGTIDTAQMLRIMEYVNCDMYFINNRQIIEYKPAGEYQIEHIFDTETLHDILDIMDCCADSNAYQDLQIQLSRIALYHLNQKGYSSEKLLADLHLHSAKLRFLYTGVENKDKTINYGLNYSDLSMLRQETGLSYQYMFTGIEQPLIEIYKNSNK